MMALLKPTIFAAALLATSDPGSAAYSEDFYLTELDVRLWYEGTGRLSESLLEKRFHLWNSSIGEGDAKENANDALFTIVVGGEGEQHFSQPMTMTATDKRGKILASRVIKSILTSKNGRATMALWVHNVGCAGLVKFSVKMGPTKVSTSLNFDCGE